MGCPPLGRKSQHAFRTGLALMEIHGRVGRLMSKHLG